MSAQAPGLEPTNHTRESELLLERCDPVNAALRLAEHGHPRIHFLLGDRAHTLNHALKVVRLREALGADRFRDGLEVIFQTWSDGRAHCGLVLANECQEHRD